MPFLKYSHKFKHVQSKRYELRQNEQCKKLCNMCERYQIGGKVQLALSFFYLLCSCPAPTVTTLATSSHAQAQPSHHSNEAVVLLCVGKNIDVITVVNTEKKYRPSQMP